MTTARTLASLSRNHSMRAIPPMRHPSKSTCGPVTCQPWPCSAPARLMAWALAWAACCGPASARPRFAPRWPSIVWPWLSDAMLPRMFSSWVQRLRMSAMSARRGSRSGSGDLFVMPPDACFRHKVPDHSSQHDECCQHSERQGCARTALGVALDRTAHRQKSAPEQCGSNQDVALEPLACALSCCERDAHCGHFLGNHTLRATALRARRCAVGNLIVAIRTRYKRHVLSPVRPCERRMLCAVRPEHKLARPNDCPQGAQKYPACYEANGHRDAEQTRPDRYQGDGQCGKGDEFGTGCHEGSLA